MALRLTRVSRVREVWSSYPSSAKSDTGHIIKSNLSRSRTRAKFCQLIASLSVILLQLKLTKLKLEVLKFDFQHKKGRYKHK